MSLDAAALKKSANDTIHGALASDPAASLLKHAVRIWARDHGVAEKDLCGLSETVVNFARSAIRERKIHVVA
jgi:hypothetical protein